MGTTVEQEKEQKHEQVREAAQQVEHEDLNAYTAGVSWTSRRRMAEWLMSPEKEQLRALARGLRRIANNLSSKGYLAPKPHGYRPLTSTSPQTATEAWVRDELQQMVQRDIALLHAVAAFIAEAHNKPLASGEDPWEIAQFTEEDRREKEWEREQQQREELMATPRHGMAVQP